MLAITPTIPIKQISKFATIASLAIFIVYFSGVFQFFYKFDNLVHGFDDVLACMKPNHLLKTIVSQEQVFSAWPPVDQHTHAYYVAQKGGYDPLIHGGEHFAIRAVKTFSDTPGIGDYDYLLIQSDGIKAVNIPAGLKQICHNAKWRLFSKSSEVQ